jgi:hypothetical protein
VKLEIKLLCLKPKRNLKNKKKHLLIKKVKILRIKKNIDFYYFKKKKILFLGESELFFFANKIILHYLLYEIKHKKKNYF